MLQIKEFAHVIAVQVGVTDEQECGIMIRYRVGSAGTEQESLLFLVKREGLPTLLRQLQDSAEALGVLHSTNARGRH